MISRQCTIAKITTMADGGVRLVIDLLDAGAHDMAEAYRLKMADTTIILAKTEEVAAALDRVQEDLL